MKSSEILTELGTTYFEAGEFDKAVDSYCKAIEQHAQTGKLFSNLATIYVQQGRYQDAIPLYQKCLELLSNPKEKSAIWGRLGNIYRGLNEHGKAIQAYQKAAEILHFENSEGSGSLVLSQGAADGEAETENLFPEATDTTTFEMVSESGETVVVYEARDEYCVSNHEAPGEEQSLGNQLLEQNASDWNELGLILFKVGSYDDAIDAFNKAIEIDQTFGYFYSNLGQVYIAQGRLEKAVDQFEKSIDLLINKKDKAVCWSRLGDIYRQLHKVDEANAAYQLADALNMVNSPSVTEFRQVALEVIKTCSGQTRDMGDIGDLVGSIRAHGIIQPLIVYSEKKDSGRYGLIAGHRRLEAARIIGLKEVPVIVRQASEEEILELSINENIHTSPVSPFELANFYRQLVNKFDLSVEEISARVGRSCHSVANNMKIFDIPGASSQSFSAEADKSSIVEQPTLISEADYQKENGNPVDPIPFLVSSERAEGPTLWYLQTESESISVGSEEIKYSASSSLLSRAQQVLQSNPHSKRSWATSSSYRA